MSESTILLVEDEPLISKVITVTLSKAGYEIESYQDGQQGYQALLDHGDNCQLVILDRTLPSLDGMDFIHYMQQDDSVKSIPVVMLTADDKSDTIINAIEAGAIDYLTKPVKSNDLLALVRRFLPQQTDSQ